MTKNAHIFIYAGEQSADMHGANLIAALKGRSPDLIFSGVGGPEMRSQGINGPLQMEDFSVMGFSDVLWSLPRLIKQFRTIRNYILKNNPRTVILIDSPDFSLPMAKSLRKAGFKGRIVQYICPTVWAWRKGRIEKMAETLDLLLTIYPFELQFFSHTSLQVKYVGNPLQDQISKHQYDPRWKRHFGIKEDLSIVSLFPGSRAGEIKHNLPAQLDSAKLILKAFPNTILAISCSSESNEKMIRQLLHQAGLENEQEIYLIPKAYSYDLMRSSRSAIAKCGTVALELALHQCPTVVMYKMSWLNKIIAKHIVKINLPRYCIVNIWSNETIFPELIAEGCSPENMASLLLPLFLPGSKRDKIISQCLELQKKFPKEASQCAADAIWNL